MHTYKNGSIEKRKEEISLGQNIKNQDKNFFKFNLEEGSYTLIFKGEKYEKDNFIIHILDANMKNKYSFEIDNDTSKNIFNLDLENEQYNIILQSKFPISKDKYKVLFIKK